MENSNCDWDLVRFLFKEKNKRNEAIHSTARVLVDENHFLTVSGFNSEKRDIIYLYEGGIYKPNGIYFIRTVLERELKKFAKAHLINEVISKVARMTLKDTNVFEGVHKNFVCLNNGIYDLDNKVLYPHSPSFYFLAKINANFVKGAECPNTLKVFRELMDEEDILFFQEFMGFILLNEYKYKKALILVGAPNTGKTTVLNIIHNIIGEDNISHISIQSIAHDKFAGGNLFGKILNTFDELSATDVQDTSLFKMATGRSEIQVDRKFQDPFKFTNKAKMLFACNKLPPIKDTDDMAYYDRWLIILFENPILCKRLNVLDEVSSSQERSGLLNWALEGLERLETKGEFSFNKTPEEVRKIMQSQNNSVCAFVQGCCEIVGGENVWITKHNLYASYVLFCNNQHLPIVSIPKFGRQFPKYCPALDGKRGDDKVWLNVRVVRDYQIIEAINPKKDEQEILKIIS